MHLRKFWPGTWIISAAEYDLPISNIAPQILPLSAEGADHINRTYFAKGVPKWVLRMDFHCIAFVTATPNERLCIKAPQDGRIIAQFVSGAVVILLWILISDLLFSSASTPSWSELWFPLLFAGFIYIFTWAAFAVAGELTLRYAKLVLRTLQ
ncbi:hypothetical protein [Celeribacter naphthalenivorans]|uniref:hypothetical protein n=1 Tax=Celeribacter naphthalenivorans TaxID=1614694 RepID=UPI001CFC3E9D|nr:hypothetical protein [Celeribacter naphthalenivorans]